MKSFEEALVELKLINEKLESGNLSLDESLSLFEKGVELISYCHGKLNEVQKKVEILVEGAGGEITKEEFDIEPEF